MKVSALDSNKDWRFGNGLSDYISNSEAIRQNVETRIKSFANDWFLDTDANIDWITYLGQKNNRGLILSEIERVVLATDGVMQILEISVDEVVSRYAIIRLRFLTIFDDEILTNAGIEL